MGERRRQEHQLDQAQQFFEAALKHYSDFQEAQVGLAAVLLAKDKPDVAIPHLQRAVALNAEDEVAWYRLSQAERAVGNTEEQKKALAQFQRLHNQIAVQKGTNVPAEVTKQELQNGEVQ
jgi:predicted Zn-dependent protease